MWIDLIKYLCGGAVGAAVVAGIFSLAGKKMDHKHEDKVADEKSIDERLDALESDMEALKQDVKNLEGNYKRNAERFGNLETSIDNLSQTVAKNNSALCNALNALLIHNISGNGDSAMKDAQAELMKHITSLPATN